MDTLDDLEKRVFLICPVRGVTAEEQSELSLYVRTLEEHGYIVHYPPRDTKQDDPIGVSICNQNRRAIADSDEVHVYWVNGKADEVRSTGSLFDLGMALALERPLYLANPDDVPQTPGRKGFNNVLRALAKDSPYAIRRR